jgi:molybdopterin-binding protein
MLRLTVGESQVLLSRITRRSRDLLNLTVGMDVFAQVKSVALMS